MFAAEAAPTKETSVTSVRGTRCPCGSNAVAVAFSRISHLESRIYPLYVRP
jgi:hypothetical protein